MSEDFLSVDLVASGTAWAAADAALVASGEAGGVGVRRLKAVAVTKILHRKRPNLVPIFDSRVYRFYCGQPPPPASYKDTPRRLWERLQPDLLAHRTRIAELAAPITTPDHRALSLLRAADIIVWQHASTGRSQSS
jgi:hypothetical protein